MLITFDLEVMLPSGMLIGPRDTVPGKMGFLFTRFKHKMYNNCA
jgi:hypothetical protein